jgi:hypothetical protein
MIVNVADAVCASRKCALVEPQHATRELLLDNVPALRPYICLLTSGLSLESVCKVRKDTTLRIRHSMRHSIQQSN